MGCLGGQIRWLPNPIHAKKKGKSMGNLMLHSGCTMTERGQLTAFRPPTETKTYKPLAHDYAVDLVINKAEEVGYKVRQQEYGCSDTGEKLFGLIKFESTVNPDHTRMVGIRNSYDKSMAFGIVSGLNICVCDNMVFSGDVKLTEKHNMNLNPEVLVNVSFALMESQCQTLETSIDTYKSIGISDEKACHTILSMAKDGIINASDTVNVMNEYKKPTFSENKDYNLNSLYNAHTFIMKKYNLTNAMRRYVMLNSMFAAIAKIGK